MTGVIANVLGSIIKLISYNFDYIIMTLSLEMMMFQASTIMSQFLEIKRLIRVQALRNHLDYLVAAA